MLCRSNLSLSDMNQETSLAYNLPKHCIVCTKQVSWDVEHNVFVWPNCGHYYCHECVNQHVYHWLSSNMIPKCKSDGCNELLTDEATRFLRPQRPWWSETCRLNTHQQCDRYIISITSNIYIETVDVVAGFIHREFKITKYLSNGKYYQRYSCLPSGIVSIICDYYKLVSIYNVKRCFNCQSMGYIIKSCTYCNHNRGIYLGTRNCNACKHTGYITCKCDECKSTTGYVTLNLKQLIKKQIVCHVCHAYYVNTPKYITTWSNVVHNNDNLHNDNNNKKINLCNECLEQALSEKKLAYRLRNCREATFVVLKLKNFEIELKSAKLKQIASYYDNGSNTRKILCEWQNLVENVCSMYSSLCIVLPVFDFLCFVLV